MKLLALLFFVLVVFPISGQAQSLFDIKEKYLDYQGVQHDFTNENLAKYPLYRVSENQNNYTITRFGDSVYLPKRSWIEYTFYPERIVPQYRIDNYSQINNLVTKVNGSLWYLTVPFSASKYESITDDLIDMGVFKRTTKISVSDSNFTCGEDCPVYVVVSKVINNDLRLYFNPQKYNTVVYPLTLTENTIFVNNSTFWTSQDCGTGYWSAFGGGSCGTPLNSMIHATLSGYWDMEGSGTNGTFYGINKFGLFPNTSIAGTGYGGVNRTIGQNWGSAGNFDGIDDYISISASYSLNLNTMSIIVNVRKNSLLGADSVVLSKQSSSGSLYENYWIRTSYGNDLPAGTIDFGIRNSTSWCYINTTSILNDVNYHSISVNRTNNSGNSNIFLDNNVVKNGMINGTPVQGFFPLFVGRSTNPTYLSGRYFNGSIDELIIDSSGNPIFSNSTYAPYWNKTFLNNTASSGKVITAVKFNISNLNVQNNTANISMRQNGTTPWTQISTNYATDTWINQTMFSNTDFLIEVYGNGSSRAFIVSGEIETHGNVTLNGTVNNTLGAPIHDALVTWDSSSVFTNESGYYEFLNVSGTHDLTTQQVGYDSNTTTLTLSSDTTQNITLQEKDWMNDIITYSMVGALFGGVLTFLLIRKKKKRYERI